VPFVLVEGNAELTPARLGGHHNPARVLREDYSSDNFVPGPLVAAMQEGGFLYIEELNRAPEDTLNTLLGAMAEREITVPRVGVITALPTFRVLASMNPFDNVGTARISDSVYDRWCRLAVGYQDEAEERDIVVVRTGCPDQQLVADAVALTRATRTHPELRRGSSVRGAIDLVAVGVELAGLAVHGDRERLVLDAALVALSGRIGVDEASEATPEAGSPRSGRTIFSRPPAGRAGTPPPDRRQCRPAARPRGRAARAGPLAAPSQAARRAARAVPVRRRLPAGARRRDLGRTGARIRRAGRRAGGAGHRAARRAARPGRAAHRGAPGARGGRAGPADRPAAGHPTPAAGPRGPSAGPAGWPRCPTGTAPTTSTWTAPSRC